MHFWKKHDFIELLIKQTFKIEMGDVPCGPSENKSSSSGGNNGGLVFQSGFVYAYNRC